MQGFHSRQASANNTMKMLNLIGLMLVMILLGSSIVFSQDIFRFIGSNRNIWISDTDLIRTLSFDQPSVNLAQNLTIRANATDDDYIEFVNFTLFRPGGTVAFAENGTRYNNLWNSTTSIINESGVWTYQVLADDNNTINTTYVNYTNTFTITDNVYTTPKILLSMGLYNVSDNNITIRTDSREMLNFTFNYTFNSTGNITLMFNVSSLRINSTANYHVLNVNISTNASSAYGLHTGNISIQRIDVLNRTWYIPINVTVSDEYGNIEFVNPTDYTFQSCPGLIYHSSQVKNLGNYQLTDCHPYLEDINGVELSSSTNFDLAAGANRTATVLYNYGTGTVVTNFVVECTATAAGGTDNTIARPEITFTAGTNCGSGNTGGGGGGAYQPPKVAELPPVSIQNISGLCGNGKCDGTETPWTCFDDCSHKVWEFESMFCTPVFDCGSWKEEWFINGVFLVLGVSLVTFMVRSGKVKRPI